MQRPLQNLVHGLDAALAAPSAGRQAALLAALRSAVEQRDWLDEDHCKPGDNSYRRHLLYADPQDRYTVVSLVWAGGQHSPVHAHHTWCGVAVYSGLLDEIFYADNGDGAVALKRLPRQAGSVSFDEGGYGIHRLGNAGGDIAISLHVYGIGAAQVSTGVNRVLDTVRQMTPPANQNAFQGS